MNRRVLAVAVSVPLAAVVLAGCDTATVPAPAPTVGQTSYAPGNEDACVWTGTEWVEEDDQEPCEWEMDGGHHATKSTRRATSTTRTAATRRPVQTTRRTAKSTTARPTRRTP